MSRVNIGVNVLRRGDIILSTTGAGSSAAIRHSLGTDVSHAALVMGDGKVIEAITTGVRIVPYSTAYADATFLMVLRRKNMNEVNRAAVVAAARQFKDRPYDTIGAAGSGISNNRGKVLAIGGFIITPLGGGITASEINRNARAENKDNSFFCSELVARAFEVAGVPIIEGNPSYANPRTLKATSTLIYVGHLTI